MPTPNSTTMYLDNETNRRLAEAAEKTGRTKIDTLRRLLDNNLELLPPFDLAVLFQVGKDMGLDSQVEAASYIIRDWQRLKQVNPR